MFVVPVSDDSLDMTFGDNEHRGFYTETFHSSAWIYHGDGVSSGPVPPSLSTRTRTVSSKLDGMSSVSFFLDTSCF